MEPYLAEVLWIVILGFILAFILAFGVGANDVANSFATSIGSGVLTFRQACYLASFFEIAGAILLGYKVSDTMRKGILDVNMYIGNEQQLMFGMLSALAGCAIWLLIATYFKLPVSTTHSIVGATVGFGLVANGTEGINVRQIVTIAASWVVSPIMSGLISVALFMVINRFILKSQRPFKAGLNALPLVYGLTIFINVLSITFDGSKRKEDFCNQSTSGSNFYQSTVLKMDNLSLWLVFTISAVAALVMAVVAYFIIAPRQKVAIIARRKAKVLTEKPSAMENGFSSGSTTTVSTVSVNSTAPVIKRGAEDEEETEENVNELFNFLQILAAIFSSFAHGGNDVR